MSLPLACPLTLISYMSLALARPLTLISYIGFINNALLENPVYSIWINWGYYDIIAKIHHIYSLRS